MKSVRHSVTRCHAKLACVAATTQVRGYLNTSMTKQTQFPNQFSVPESVAPKGFRHLIKSGYGRPLVEAAKVESVNPEKVTWENEAGETTTGADVLEVETHEPFPEPRKAERQYAPLAQIAKIELRGDYLTEAKLAQEALEHYGVAMAGYEAAYPAAHNQIAKMRIKVGRALRMTGRLESAKASLETALEVLSSLEKPIVEHVVEALLELGEVHMARKEFAVAATVFEDCHTVLYGTHDIAASHRGLRQIKWNARQLHMRCANKFIHYSAYSHDRVFAITDTALMQAERAYRLAGDQDGVVRALELRSQMTDRKYFAMRDFAFKYGRARGRTMQRGRAISARPSAQEILAFSPTVHQPYFDYSALSTAPLGKEHLVSVGANAKMLDDGDPTRFMEAKSKKIRRDRAAVESTIKRHWEKPFKKPE